MIYKIYPVSEEKWLKIWKKIKTVCRQQGLQIVKIELEDYIDKSYSGLEGKTSIIHISEQTELFKSSNNTSSPQE